jgi:hypothetical protein
MKSLPELATSVATNIVNAISVGTVFIKGRWKQKNHRTARILLQKTIATGIGNWSSSPNDFSKKTLYELRRWGGMRLPAQSL